MDLTYPPEAEAFRTEVRRWLEANLPRGWFDPGFELVGAESEAFNEAWVAALCDGGWICASWPEEYGGRGLSVMQNVVMAEEFARRGRRCAPTSSVTPSSVPPSSSGGPPSRSRSSSRGSRRGRSAGARASASQMPAPIWLASPPGPCSTVTSG